MTNRERVKHIEAMLDAEERGDEVQYSSTGDSWFKSGSLKYNTSTLFRNPERYRIKPKPVTRPWSKPEDVPGPVCWIRGNRESNVNDVQRLVMCVHPGSLSYAPGGSHHLVSLSELAEKWEHSIDRKTWHPCTVTEESK